MWNIIFLITGAIFIAFLLIIFFSKEVIDSKENIFFKALILVNCLEYCAEIPLQLFVRSLGIDVTIVDIFSKFYLATIFTWFSFFSIYTFIICISKKDNDKYEKQVSISKNINLVIWVIGFILLTVLPFNKFYEGDKMYIYGGAVDVLKMFLGAYMLVWIFLLLKNIKNIKEKKYAPIFLVLVLLGLNTIFQTIDPSILIASMIGTFICYIMAFTIENPDMKMLEEIENNRDLIERQMEEKSNLLFKISQDVRIPINNIEQISNDMLNEKKVSDLVNNAKVINSESKNVSFIVNNLLDISSMDINNIKLYKTKININSLLKEIDLMFNKKDFKYSILNTIPDIYGDNVRLKQILVSIINYEYEHNNNSVFLELSGIIRYDVCRLSINIISDGKRIDLVKINNILDSETDTNIDINDLKLDLISIKTLINMLNGSFNIKSDDKGNIYSFIIDSEIVKKDNKLTNNYINKKRVLLIDDDIEELKQYSKELKKYNIDVTTSMFGNDVIQKQENKEEYDLIIIDDEMQPYNAVNIVEKINKKKLKSKIIVMLGINKEFIKNHYIKDYKFDDYILKREYTKEIERIIDKYL